jgi:uncharacterized membrane protein
MQTQLSRQHHIDLLRGLIIILMIVDHAMVYCYDYFVNDPMDVPGTEPKIFLSRLLAHFCAPLFAFLAGISAALTERRFDTKETLAKHLIMRGLVLILLEFTIISWSWSFNPLFPMLYAQVIWAIGWGFIILGILRLAGVQVVLIFGLLVVFGHNLLDGIRFPDNTWMHYVWSVLHQKNVLALPFDFRVRTTYPISSIAGLMCLAYIAGRYYVNESFSKAVEKKALWLGFFCLIGYGILRGFNLYGDSGKFEVHDNLMLTLMSFFNPTKYPLSLQFMLLTVGSGFILLFLFKRLKPDFSKNFLQVLGRTSMFSYILHLYLLHAISWILIPFFGFKFSNMTYGETLIGLPEGFGLSYIQTLILVAVVVTLCTLIAKPYLKWKGANKNNLIARYI